MDHRVRVKKVSFSDSDSCHDGDSDLESRLLSADDSILRSSFCDEEDGLVGSTRLAVDVSSSSNASTVGT